MENDCGSSAHSNPAGGDPDFVVTVGFTVGYSYWSPMDFSIAS
jgi:hypothetical protein